MGTDYSVETIQKLEDIFTQQHLARPLNIKNYEPGKELFYAVKGVVPAKSASVKIRIEKFVGGGYAGQVYKIRVLNLETPEGPLYGLTEGQTYALKILIPPSGFARLFRNFIFGLAFQGPFSLQVNPAASRAGALWQKFIRQGAAIRLGTEKAVVDILATVIDPTLGSCGEISEWIEGRMWRFEVEDNLDARRKKEAGQKEAAQSPEYLSKRSFMAHLVSLLHEMGAVELARQYEWWTCKSQPNALKRTSSDPAPEEGLVAVDFRAGLALLPFIPMCPKDFSLILKGIARGSWVQFDRGDLSKLQEFINQNPAVFSGMEEALEELKSSEKIYRDSLPDIFHHHFKLLYKRTLWTSIRKGNIQSWRIRNITDDKATERLSKKVVLSLLFTFLGFIPILGRFIRKLWGRADFRLHTKKFLTSLNYFGRSLRAKRAESLIRWHKAGRVSAERALRIASSPLRFVSHFPLSFLPPGLHRFFTDKKTFLQVLDHIFARPLRLYFKQDAREKWLRDMVSQGYKNGMLTEKEASEINDQVKDPFIQKYLKSMAVHVCTLPITQIVSAIVAFVYVRLHPELSFAEASLRFGLILGLFQVTPISPGSLVRGLYVTVLVLRERNFKDYSIAFFLSFFKYIGYLAFPIQMAYRYPDLARFMAGHWATSAVHIVPIFGERGALLEHFVFDLFYNYPLTIRRRLRERQERREGLQTRAWHIPLIVFSGLAALSAIGWIYFQQAGLLPSLKDIWWAVLWIPLLTAAAISIWAGGASLSKRILMSVGGGAVLALCYSLLETAMSVYVFPSGNEVLSLMQFLGQAGVSALWKVFLFTFLSIVSSLAAETRRLKPAF
ncbi:MAG: hypothetical protein MUP98_10855 [Candidatus Aminicenantes bacterium]|nr:hypothetical protein [Candidatus Aminicenantes bacterium]